MEIMSLALETGYKCKDCDGYIFGYYVWLEQKMYFHGVVDFDLSKGKRLTTEQNDKFFNLQLTKPRPVTKEQKKTKPYALDYRSVCD